MTAVLSFFAVTWMKIGKASSADARRRLILLVNGASLALTPLSFSCSMDCFFTDWSHCRAVWIPCILMLALFPITLAYVIVVQRTGCEPSSSARGCDYALAKRAMLVVQAASRFQQSSSALYSSPPIPSAIARANLRPWHPVLSP